MWILILKNWLDGSLKFYITGIIPLLPPNQIFLLLMSYLITMHAPSKLRHGVFLHFWNPLFLLPNPRPAFMIRNLILYQEHHIHFFACFHLGSFLSKPVFNLEHFCVKFFCLPKIFFIPNILFRNFLSFRN